MSNRTVEVRAARYDEVFQIRDTINEARLTSDIPLPEVEEPWAIQYTLDLIRFGFVWVAVTDKQVVGVAIVNKLHWQWNRGAFFLENSHFWVLPKHRKGGTAIRLLQCMKDRAKELGLPLSVRITHSDGAADTKDRFLKMQGLKYLGGTFWFQG